MKIGAKYQFNSRKWCIDHSMPLELLDEEEIDYKVICLEIINEDEFLGLIGNSSGRFIIQYFDLIEEGELQSHYELLVLYQP